MSPLYYQKNKAKLDTANRAWARNHPERVRAITRKAQAKFRKNRKDFILWLKKLPCGECGKSYAPQVMDFHHRNPIEKEFAISAWSASGASQDALLKELQKCDLFCSNCHRGKH